MPENSMLSWGERGKNYAGGLKPMIAPQLPSVNIGGWESQFATKGATGYDKGGIGNDAGIGIDVRGKVLPDVEGGWLKKGKFGLDVAKVGLGVYNALETSKMNKFMKSYYGEEMDRNRVDFENAARGTNEALASRHSRQLDAAGMGTYGSEENKAGTAQFMNKWGAKESY